MMYIRGRNGTMRVMVIDDDEVVARVAVEFLLTSGMEAEAATNSRKALQVLDGGGIDVVLCDILMPEKDGFEVIREIKAKFPRIPVIAMTGGSQRLDPSSLLKIAAAFGAIEVLLKPFSMDELLAAIAKISP
jgi:CheY-like chemotaxis protein